jgi:branched-subunit amino acid ABC-type transport system permease component
MRGVSTVTEWLPSIVTGLVIGSIYSIAGMGLVLTFRTSGVFNFAHGSFAAVAAYVFFELWNDVAIPWPVAVLLTLLIVGVGGGLVLERLARLLSDASTAARVVATVGLLVLLQGAITLRYGFQSIAVRDRFLPDGVTVIADTAIRTDQLIVMGIALVAAIGLYLFFKRSRTGVAMQGVVDDPALLGLQGISPAKVRRTAWIVGTSFAALSGVLLAPESGFVDVNILTLLVVQAFGAAAIGAFNSLPLTYAGGLVVGVLFSVSVKAVADTPSLSGLPSNVPFLVLFFGLLVTPKKKLIERGSRIVRRAPPPPTFSRNTLTFGAVLGGVALLLVPAFADLRLVAYIDAMAFVVVFASLALLVNLSGQVSLCHIVFVAIGATTFAHAANAGVPWGLAVLVGGAAALPVGAVVAIPAIRLSGVYLAVATLGFGILIERTFFGSFLMFGVQQSVEGPRPGVLFTSDTAYFYLVTAIALGCCGLVLLVRASRLGRLLRAMADSDAALAAHGTNTSITRVFVFCISAFLAGIGGAVAVPATGTASALQYQFFLSLVIVAILAISGRLPLLSPFIAAILFRILPQEAPDPALLDWQNVLFGAAALIAAIGPLRRIIDAASGSRRFERRSLSRSTRGSPRDDPGSEATPDDAAAGDREPELV